MIEDTSAWKNFIGASSYPQIRSDLECDVLIIGGGLFGVWALYLLSVVGKKAALVEKNSIGSGASGLTTGFLTQSLDTDPSDLIKIFGIEKAKKVIESHAKAIALTKSVSEIEKIGCEFTACSNFIYITKNSDKKRLDNECAALNAIGTDAHIISKKDHLGFPNQGAIEIKDQAKFHPLKFIFGLSEASEKSGALIFKNSEILSIEKTGVGKFKAKSDKANITADWIISATYTPFKRPLPLHIKKAVYRTYVFELDLQKNNIPEATYEDTSNPYHYFRIDSINGRSRAIVGGEDHRNDIKIDPWKNFSALKEFSDKTFTEGYVITKKWSGPIVEPVDGLPFIGPTKPADRIIYATGFSGNGMTYSAIAGQIARDLITGSKNPYYDIYRADRTPTLNSLLTKSADYLEELGYGAIKNSLRKNKEI